MQPRSYLGFGLRFALPNHLDSPAQSAEGADHEIVSNYIAGDLGLPEFSIAARKFRALAALVSMPEAAMDENDHPRSWKDDVGRTWQVFPVDAESQAKSVSESSHSEFGRRILLPHLRHQRRACGGGANEVSVRAKGRYIGVVFRVGLQMHHLWTV